jgi:hypothetical protein
MMEDTMPGRRTSRWSRTHTIWLLMLLSLVPGGVILLDRELWTELPAGLRAAGYLISTVLIVAACALILRNPTATAKGIDSPQR